MLELLGGAMKTKKLSQYSHHDRLCIITIIVLVRFIMYCG